MQPAASSAPPPAPVAVSPDQPVPEEFDLLCEACGYSLVGLMVDRCPECGATFDAAQLPLARVPWLYRKRLGRFGAYVQTLRFALLRPRVFAAELCRPVRISERDAQQFRKLTILIGATGVAAGLAGFLERVEGFWPPRDATIQLVATCLGVWVGMFIVLRMCTDLPTFIWSGLPGRSDDLSPLHHYAAAPLALLLPGGLAFIGLFYGFGYGVPWGEALLLIALIATLALLAVVLAWGWLTAMLFMRTAARCSLGRVALLGAYLPVHWLMMTSMVLMAAGAIAYYGAEFIW